MFLFFFFYVFVGPKLFDRYSGARFSRGNSRLAEKMCDAFLPHRRRSWVWIVLRCLLFRRSQPPLCRACWLLGFQDPLTFLNGDCFNAILSDSISGYDFFRLAETIVTINCFIPRLFFYKNNIRMIFFFRFWFVFTAWPRVRNKAIFKSTYWRGGEAKRKQNENPIIIDNNSVSVVITVYYFWSSVIKNVQYIFRIIPVSVK